MAPEDRDAALAQAEHKGFDTKPLEYTPLGPEPSGTPAPPVTYGYGCRAAPALSGSGIASATAALVGLVLFQLKRRRAAAHSALEGARRES